mgnify:CR=1 FL=1
MARERPARIRSHPPPRFFVLVLPLKTPQKHRLPCINNRSGVTSKCTRRSHATATRVQGGTYGSRSQAPSTHRTVNPAYRACTRCTNGSWPTPPTTGGSCIISRDTPGRPAHTTMARNRRQGSRPSQLPRCPPWSHAAPAEDTHGYAPVASTRLALRAEESTNEGVGSEESTTGPPAALIDPPFPRANFAPHPSAPPRAHLKAARPLKAKGTARSGRAGSTQAAARVGRRGRGARHRLVGRHAAAPTGPYG